MTHFLIGGGPKDEKGWAIICIKEQCLSVLVFSVLRALHHILFYETHSMLLAVVIIYTV